MSSMTAYGVRLEIRGRVALLILDRPRRHNAFDAAMWASLAESAARLHAAPPRAVVITGAGERAFCAGFDVSLDNPQVAALVEAMEQRRQAPADALLRDIRRVVDDLCALPVPLIAAINGDAYGGGAELAVRCDLRVMDPGAVVCFSEVRLGLMPDWGGGPALVRLVGPGRAADLILTARRLPAREALELGVINRLSAPGRCLEEALELAEAIAANGPRAVRAALSLIRTAADLPLAQALDRERDTAAALIASGECLRGVEAFLKGQVPEFEDPLPDTASTHHHSP
jgi:enoyl-CoA hydratase/carnithine racemase